MSAKAAVLAIISFAFFYTLPYYFNLNWTLQIDFYNFSFLFNWIHVIGFFFTLAIYLAASWIDRDQPKKVTWDG